MKNRPNFIIFITDTQGANVVGCYGNKELHTPNIDKLAEKGVRFERAYTTCPVCTPARAGLFTGVYPHNSGPWANSIPLYENTLTMGQYFSRQGYHCAYSGKWHLSGHDYFDTGICPDGWDPEYWYDGKNYLDDLSPEERALWRRAADSIDQIPDDKITADFTWAHRVSDRGIDFLNKHDDDPFVMVLSYDEPHHPWACPREFMEPFLDYRYPISPAGEDTLDNKPSIQKMWAEKVRNIPAHCHPLRDGAFYLPLFFGCNSFVDHEIGRVVDEVDRLKLDNTWIIFTSDHGDLMGDHQLLSKGACMYDGAARIPLIVTPPPDQCEKTVIQTAVSHADILPTMMNLAGLESPPILDGDDIGSLLKGEENPQKPAFIEFNRFEIGHDSAGGFQPIRCVVRDNLKLAVNLMSTDELYDLAMDPNELKNLIDDPDYAEQRDELHSLLLNWMYERRDPFRGYVWEQRPWSDSRKLTWQGPYRPRHDDGYWPVELSYATGEPMS